MTSLRKQRQAEYLRELDEHYSELTLQESSGGSFEGWFLGPKGENEELLTQLLLEAVWKHCEQRRGYRPEDPTYITNLTKQSPEYRKAVDNLKRYASEMFTHLQLSVPIASMRSQGHMLWDQVLPAMVGYFGAMLYNQNNVAAEASPYTTQLEIHVGNDLCRMLGFDVPSKDPPAGTIAPWGHITCDGSVANLEGLWAARNVKFYPIALKAALQHSSDLRNAKGLKVSLLNGSKASLIDLDDWQLLNLKIDDVLSLPQTLRSEFKIEPPVTDRAVSAFSVQNLGLVDFYRKFLPNCKPPVVFAPDTAHYSWQKAATLLGLGRSNLRGVDVNFEARMNAEDLYEQLQAALKNREPVIAVVAVIGSTEQNAVDPLHHILWLREELRADGLDFAIHADAAWGGYFASLLRTDEEMNAAAPVTVLPEVPTIECNPYVHQQLLALDRADSVTVDPHKSGYVPYPAGGLCYRNSAMRDMVSLKSPVVFHSQSEPTVGIYGVEGWMPGAAATEVFLAHKVIRPTRDGYGKILRQCLWSSRRMYCRLATMPDTRVKLVCLQMTPAERIRESEDAIAAQKQYIRQNFVLRSNAELEAFLHQNHQAAELFAELGSDGVILTFSFNFFDPKTGLLNVDLKKLNELNQSIFEKCSMMKPPASLEQLNRLPLILTSSSFTTRTYGSHFMDHYCHRLGVNSSPDAEVNFLISTTMDPWTTETSHGDFLGVVEQTLRDVAHQSLDELKEVWNARKSN